MSRKGILSFNVDGKSFEAKGGFDFEPGRPVALPRWSSPMMLRFRISVLIGRLGSRIKRYADLIKRTRDRRLIKHYNFCINKAQQSMAALLVKFNRLTYD